MKKLFVVLAILFIGILIAGCTSQPPAPVVTPTPTAVPTPVPTTVVPVEKTALDTAVADGRFTTLVAAVQTANLTTTLNGAGPFTIFAPTDDAFKKLPNGTVATREILLYHVVTGNLMAADLMNLSYVKTVQGDNITLTSKNGTLMVNGAKVIAADIKTSNGVIHVIDSVIMPPGKAGDPHCDPDPAALNHDHLLQGNDHYAEYNCVYQGRQQGNLEEHGSLKTPWCGSY